MVRYQRSCCPGRNLCIDLKVLRYCEKIGLTLVVVFCFSLVRQPGSVKQGTIWHIVQCSVLWHTFGQTFVTWATWECEGADSPSGPQRPARRKAKGKRLQSITSCKIYRRRTNECMGRHLACLSRDRSAPKYRKHSVSRLTESRFLFAALRRNYNRRAATGDWRDGALAVPPLLQNDAGGANTQHAWPVEG